MSKISTLANPSFFMSLSDRVLPWVAAISAALFAVGLYLSFTVEPDYQQGETVRIMFIHVPMAWLSMFGYVMITISSLGSLIWRHPLADVSAKVAAPIGAAFTFAALVTGALWGRPMWGAYWVWDARLTSVLILFFLYLGLIALWHAIEDHSRAARAAAILAIVGSINIPIIKFSVHWWSSLHQGESAIQFQKTADGIKMTSGLDTPYLVALLVMVFAFSFMFIWLHMKGMRAEILRRRVESMMITRVSRASELKPAE